MQQRLAYLLLLCSLFSLASCSPAAAPPAFKPVTLYYSAFDTTSSQMTVSALDGSSGKQRWNYTTSTKFGTQPVLADGIVYVMAGSGLSALSASDGKVLWNNSTLTNANIIGEGNGVLYVNLFTSANCQATAANLGAINTSDGSVRWSYQFDNGQGNVLDNGVMYASDTLTPTGTPTSPNGAILLAVNASDGSFKEKGQDSHPLMIFDIQKR